MFQKGLFIDEPKVNLSKRRAGMIKSPPEWDVEWSGEDGVVPSDVGFIQSITGTGSESLMTKSIKVYATGTSSNVIYRYPTTGFIGVIETEIRIYTNNSWFYVIFGDGTNTIAIRMQYSSNYKGIYLRNDSSMANMQKLQSISLEVTYKIKLVFRGSTADVYVDDILLASDVDTSTIYSPETATKLTVVEFGRAASGQGNGNIYSIKLKLGRI